MSIMSELPTRSRGPARITAEPLDRTAAPHVLIADRNPVSRAARERQLLGSGFRVSVARTGFEALKLIDCCPVDLVVLDLLLPGVDGFTVREELAAHPGTTDADMLELALWLKKNGYRADQVQACLPGPMATATAMYHSGKNPLKRVTRTSEDVTIPRGLKVRPDCSYAEAYMQRHPETLDLLNE